MLCVQERSQDLHLDFEELAELAKHFEAFGDDGDVVGLHSILVRCKILGKKDGTSVADREFLEVLQ
jgi:hypothetical protein